VLREIAEFDCCPGRGHLFVGAGLDFWPEYTTEVKRLVRQLDPDDRAHFLGVLTDEKLAFMCQNCDAFVRLDESCGR
jgi:glycosyltransferase involved in cell wall biosynthesis